VLRKYADEMFTRSLGSGQKDLDDYKLTICPSKLKDLIGEESFNELESLFGQPYDEILIRRCQAHG
jgi:predicted 2-oxoglutarate/Fe(II)-dependent dioxygenase YbiX